jgi:hypothetical protein
MALKGFWGFDSAQVKYPEFAQVLSSVNGRDGVANHGTSFVGNGTATLNWPGGGTTPSFILGAAWNFGGLGNNSIRMCHPVMATVQQFFVAPDGLGRLAVWTANTIQVAATPIFLGAPAWYYVEIKFVAHPTAGQVIIRVNEVELLNYVGQTTAVGTTTIDSIQFREANSTNGIDDMYLLDLTDETATAGRANNTFLGDVKVAHLYPTADGSSSGLTPSIAGAHWSLVDENPVNTTDYVSALGGGTAKDTYQMQDLPAAASVVYGVKAGLYSAKTDAGAASFKTVIRESDGSETVGAAQSQSVSYTGYYSGMLTKKTAGGLLLPADINAMQVGAQIA